MSLKTAMSQVSKFNTMEAAQRFVDMASKRLYILHGDDNLYWVTSGRVAGWLEQQGYEIL